MFRPGKKRRTRRLLGTESRRWRRTRTRAPSPMSREESGSDAGLVRPCVRTCLRTPLYSVRHRGGGPGRRSPPPSHQIWCLGRPAGHRPSALRCGHRRVSGPMGRARARGAGRSPSGQMGVAGRAGRRARGSSSGQMGAAAVGERAGRGVPGARAGRPGAWRPAGTMGAERRRRRRWWSRRAVAGDPVTEVGAGAGAGSGGWGPWPRRAATVGSGSGEPGPTGEPESGAGVGGSASP